jgi:hypothetical protein
MTPRKRRKKAARKSPRKQLSEQQRQFHELLDSSFFATMKAHQEAMIATLTACTNVLERCALAFERMPLYVVGDTAPEHKTGGINGASEPPPPLPAELSEGELADVQRSIAPPDQRLPVPIRGQE